MQQVVTIAPDGIISGIQHKPGKGLDLRKFGPCDVKRASDIRATDDGQRWRIHLMTGPYAGRDVDIDLVHRAGLFAPKDLDPINVRMARGGIIEVDEYDEAVLVEVAVLDGLRIKGEF